MPGEPWDVPETADGREALERLAEEYEAAGKTRELGITLARLGWFYRQFGTGREHIGAFPAANAVAVRAVELLRQTDDRMALAGALRAAAHPFFEGVDQAAMLEEVLSISKELDDLSGQGRALFAMSSLSVPSPSDLLEQAKACFEKAGDTQGLAWVHQRIGAQTNRPGLLAAAAEQYLGLGRIVDAERAYAMASVFGRDSVSFETREGYLLKAVDLAEKRESVESQVSYLKQLGHLMKDAGRPDEMKRYRARAASLKRSEKRLGS